MPSGVRDIQLLELKDTISQLNNTISTQNELIRSLQKMLQERDAKDSERDQLIANLQAQLDYLKTRLLGSTSAGTLKIVRMCQNTQFLHGLFHP